MARPVEALAIVVGDEGVVEVEVCVQPALQVPPSFVLYRPDLAARWTLHTRGNIFG